MALKYALQLNILLEMCSCNLKVALQRLILFRSEESETDRCKQKIKLVVQIDKNSKDLFSRFGNNYLKKVISKYTFELG